MGHDTSKQEQAARWEEQEQQELPCPKLQPADESLLDVTRRIFHGASPADGTAAKPSSSCVCFVEAVLQTGFPFLDWLWSWGKRFQKKKMQTDGFRGAGSQSSWKVEEGQ